MYQPSGLANTSLENKPSHLIRPLWECLWAGKHSWCFQQEFHVWAALLLLLLFSLPVPRLWDEALAAGGDRAQSTTRVWKNKCVGRWEMPSASGKGLDVSNNPGSFPSLPPTAALGSRRWECEGSASLPGVIPLKERFPQRE